ATPRLIRVKAGLQTAKPSARFGAEANGFAFVPLDGAVPHTTSAGVVGLAKGRSLRPANWEIQRPRDGFFATACAFRTTSLCTKRRSLYGPNFVSSGPNLFPMEGPCAVARLA